ncbi:hypothetical protein ACPF7I_02080 [Anoxybacillus sp. D401a]|uniref:hypothetical protein n=1 Tax=Anoxybacillus sp. D401a TaxID=575112 RepID=UPI003D348C00
MKDILKIMSVGLLILITGLFILYLILQQSFHPLSIIVIMAFLHLIVPTTVGVLAGHRLKHSRATIAGGGGAFFTFWPSMVIAWLFVRLEKVRNAIDKINRAQNTNDDQMVSIGIKLDIISAMSQVFVWILLGTIGAWIARKFIRRNSTSVKE